MIVCPVAAAVALTVKIAGGVVMVLVTGDVSVTVGKAATVRVLAAEVAVSPRLVVTLAVRL